MRRSTLIVVIWLLVGAAAAGQRSYFGKHASCGNVGTIVVTMATGPLNYLGLDPKLNCKLPSPSG